MQVDDMDERMKLMAFFSMMRPIALLGAPVFGGGVASALGWRNLFYILLGWGALTLVLVWAFIPESNSVQVEREKKEKEAAQRASQEGAGADKECGAVPQVCALCSAGRGLRVGPCCDTCRGARCIPVCGHRQVRVLTQRCCCCCCAGCERACGAAPPREQLWQ